MPNIKNRPAEFTTFAAALTYVLTQLAANNHVDWQYLVLGAIPSIVSYVVDARKRARLVKEIVGIAHELGLSLKDVKDAQKLADTTAEQVKAQVVQDTVVDALGAQVTTGPTTIVVNTPQVTEIPIVPADPHTDDAA